MTRERCKELLPVLLPILEAYARGEKIQVLSRPGQWVDAFDELMFDSAHLTPFPYRIKPKPLEVWVVVSTSPLDAGSVYGTFQQREDAEKCTNAHKGISIIKLREVEEGQ
jgi:hypothetical protein